jgi:hypothetical protein
LIGDSQDCLKLIYSERTFLFGLSSSSADNTDKFGGIIQAHSVPTRAPEQHLDQSEVVVKARKFRRQIDN